MKGFGMSIPYLFPVLYDTELFLSIVYDTQIAFCLMRKRPR